MMLQKAKSDRFLGGFFALAVSSTLLGVFAGWILPDFLSFEHYLHSLVAWVRGGARSVGIAIIGLAPTLYLGRASVVSAVCQGYDRLG